jgi:predicted DCC family thiol-disulfide oxidoreductase YuxK
VRPVVLYDADCNFCATVAGALASWDRPQQLRFATIQGPIGEEHLADLTSEQRLASVHFVDRDGRRWSGGEAMPPLLDQLPAGGPVAASLRRLAGPTDRAYHCVADHRVGISRLVPSRWKRWGRAKLRSREMA